MIEFPREYRGLSAAGKWVYGSLIIDHAPVFSIRHLTAEYPVDNTGQFIGILDKNHKKIFEHDLIKATQPNSYLGGNDDIYEVIYYPAYTMFCLLVVSSKFEARVGRVPLTRNNHPYFITPKRTEIIGNRAQNPELIMQTVLTRNLKKQPLKT